MFIDKNRKSPIAWLGGKSKLAAAIVARLPKHTTYCEPFAGAAWVLFTKPPSKVEIINDINRDLVTMYRCIKHHKAALFDELAWLASSRDEFERFMATPPHVLTDIQRAARFYYINRTAFGAKPCDQHYALCVTSAGRFNPQRAEQDFTRASERLRRVQIENRPYAQVIANVDRPETLFYLDPPYWGCENDYGKGLFSRDDFAALAEQLAGIKGKFILSLNDTAGVREVFAAFHIEQVQTSYSINKGTGAQLNELLISNFPPAPAASGAGAAAEVAES